VSAHGVARLAEVDPARPRYGHVFETSSLGDAEEVVVHVARVVAGVRGWEGRGWMSASISGAMPAGWA